MLPKQLKKRFQLIFVDQRAFAKTKNNLQAQQFSLTHIVQDLEVFRKKLKIQTWSIFGHSGNGYVALSYARAFPKRVIHLLLSALSPDLSSSTFEQAESFWEQDASDERKRYFQNQITLLEQDLNDYPEEKLAYVCHRTSAKRWFDFKFNELSLWNDVSCSDVAFDALWGDAFTKPTWFTDGFVFPMRTWLTLGRYDCVLPSHSIT